jgi:hypothetical protein
VERSTTFDLFEANIVVAIHAHVAAFRQIAKLAAFYHTGLQFTNSLFSKLSTAAQQKQSSNDKKY